MDGAQIRRIIREDTRHMNDSWKMGRWTPIDGYFERIHQDPDFVEIDESEANELIQIVGFEN